MNSGLIIGRLAQIMPTEHSAIVQITPEISSKEGSVLVDAAFKDGMRKQETNTTLNRQSILALE